MDHLFNRLDGAYPNRWRAAFPNEYAVSNWREAWAEAFDEEGITTQMISDALRACRKTYDWPPSLAEFLKVCKPAVDADAALHEAVEQMRARQHGKDEWSHPAIFWAAVKVGEFDMLGQTFAALKPRFESALRKVLDGGEFQPVPARVPALQGPSAAESTREHGRNRLDGLRASEILKSITTGGSAEWAQRIIATEKATGRVPLNKLKIAKQAIQQV
ncbi:hypothetical protein CIC12_03640 [Burkholderia sp. SG-MS1]|uniref:replication protein P n=1 Tax=Paraburkholderia sp. SG-MS1 TaxID=2023741 RepID=UPI001448A19B|nr:replication protein P [Paraburkholderia sp. SG-MS1]NKJ45849.1 hypothetical protein [Paraburkholderia sp. SG-MS1]